VYPGKKNPGSNLLQPGHYLLLSRHPCEFLVVIPAEAGIQVSEVRWVPACAGMTTRFRSDGVSLNRV